MGLLVPSDRPLLQLLQVRLLIIRRIIVFGVCFSRNRRDESILGDAGMRGYNLPFLVKLLEVHDTVAF